ncbi:hypothetical protein JCM11641_006856 [Rhodosporidiobolus odoratus]
MSSGLPYHSRTGSIASYHDEEASPLDPDPSTALRDKQELNDPLVGSRGRRRNRTSCSNKLYDHRWLAFALVFGVVLGQARWRWQDEQVTASQSIALAAAAKGGDVRLGVWGDRGMRGAAPVGTKTVRPKEIKDCERTLLLDWESFQYGFGSTAITVTQAAFFAKRHGYTVLFSRKANSYGSYLDSIRSLNWYVANNTYTMPDLDSLPDLSAVRAPAPLDNVPTLYRQRFFQFSALAKEHFTLNPRLQARVSQLVRQYGLDDPARQVPTIGVHYRGGDKLRDECHASEFISCGNITLHLQTALESIPSISSAKSPKPRLLLMTVEPDAFEVFKADPLASNFEMVELERGGVNKAFVQDEWKSLPETDRLEDTHRMLTQGDLLANYVDAAIVSANSNSARLMFTRAGPARVLDESRVRSVDIPWHPVQWSPFKGRCDGTFGGCWPA